MFIWCCAADARPIHVTLIGFLAGSLRSARQANARVDAVIAAMPTAARASLYLESYGGSISLGPINEADGTRRQGVIIVPGGLHLDTPWTSTDGATVIPDTVAVFQPRSA
jgi:hypothetical protein